MNKTVLNYQELGPPNAPALVFLHGFMGQASSLQTVLKGLADSFRCLAFDLPGHGASLFSSFPRLAQLTGPEETAALILEDLAKLNIRRFSLFGYSMGGRIAQHVAVASPGSIHKLILESASFGIADLSEREKRRLRDESLLENIATRTEFQVFLENWHRQPLFQTLSKTVHLPGLILEKINHSVAEYRQALNLLSVGRQAFLAGRLAQANLSIYYFCGEKDKAYRQTALAMQALIPGMTVEVFKNASHNIHLQYPQEIISALRKILL